MTAPMIEPQPEVRLGRRQVGPGHPPYVIAELSANHGGSLPKAKELVRLAADAGVDAIKLQTFTPDSMTLDIDQPPFVVGSGSPWAGRTLHDLYREAQTPWEWHAPLADLATSLGLDFLSTPFDRDAVDFLEQFDPPAHKIASFELLDLDLIRYAAATGRPLIVSTGMASADEIGDAVGAATDGGATGLVLLRCNSAYPAPADEMDLATVPEMARRWNVPVGLSDHSSSSIAAVVATALGACVFEKHLIASRADGGPDASFSVEPSEMRELVDDVHQAFAAKGRVRFGPSSAERSSLSFRRSLYAVVDIPAGGTLTVENVRAIRPGGGLPPKRLGEIIGRRAVVGIPRGTPLADDLID